MYSSCFIVLDIFKGSIFRLATGNRWHISPSRNLFQDIIYRTTVDGYICKLMHTKYTVVRALCLSRLCAKSVNTQKKHKHAVTYSQNCQGSNLIGTAVHILVQLCTSWYSQCRACV